MRAKEFIVEYKLGQVEEFQGVDMKLETTRLGAIVVKALDDWGNEIARAHFHDMDGDFIEAQSLWVEPEFRGQGVARKMYDFVTSHGYEIHKSPDVTKIKDQGKQSGEHHWQKNRGEETIWEDLTQGRNLNPDTEKYIKSHKWKLTTVNPMELDTDAFDDPYGRVIDIDTSHPVNFKDPIIVDSNGVIIDGFHRAYQAQRAGLKTIPAYVPVQEQLEESASPVVYHGNQGGIHNQLIAPMWWTESKQDAIMYATQNGADGWVYSAKLSCKNPYVIKPTDETNTVLEKHKQLQQQGYDCIYDESVGDWIPFYSKDIHLVGKPEYQEGEQEVSEAFTQPYSIKWERGEHGDYDALAKLSDGTNLSIMFNDEGDEEWMVEFYRSNSQELTGEGDAQRVFATVLTAIQQFIQKEHPWRIIFSAKQEVEPGEYNPSRSKLYNRMVQRYANAWGYDEYYEDQGDQVVYELTRKK